MFEENPLADFVELPDDGRAQNELWYSNILCGVLRGAMEMVSVCMSLFEALVFRGAEELIYGLCEQHKCTVLTARVGRGRVGSNAGRCTLRE